MYGTQLAERRLLLAYYEQTILSLTLQFNLILAHIASMLAVSSAAAVNSQLNLAYVHTTEV